MSCYRLSPTCWGTEWPVLIDGNLEMLCTGHKNGEYKKPILRVEAGGDIVSGYKSVKEYLETFVTKEIGDVPFDVYGVGNLGEIAAQVYAHNHDNAQTVDGGKPTHVFMVGDLDQLERIDAMVDMDIVVNMLTL